MVRGTTTSAHLTPAQLAAKKETAEKKKKADFVRIYQARVSKAIKSIKLVGNCYGAGYSYTAEQANQGLVAMGDTLKDVVTQSQKTAKKEDSGFKLT